MQIFTKRLRVKNIAFIVNPISGGKKKRTLPLLIRKFFSYANGYNVTFYRTKCAGDAVVAAKRFADEGCHIVVATGGDGTVNEVARGLVGSSTALGIVPLGSGNGFARHLGISMNPRKALKYIASATPYRIDYGLINDIPFFCTAGVGFDALVGDKFAKSGKRGFTSYLKQILREAFTYKPEQYSLTIDGKTIQREAFLVTFANASQWGYNACIAPKASLSDGLLDVVVVSKFSLLRAPEVGVRLLARRIDKLRFVETFKCQTAALKRAHEGCIHFDGEPWHLGREVNVKMVGGALTVLTNKKNV